MIVRVVIVILCFISIGSFAQVTNTRNVDRDSTSSGRVIKVLPIRLPFSEHEKFELKLYNYDGDHLLWEHEGRAQGEGELFMIDPQPYVKYGLRKFRLLIVDRKKIDTVFFRVDHNGSVIKE